MSDTITNILLPFCSKQPMTKYDVTTPFTIGDWTYATNYRAAVRVPAWPAYPPTNDAKHPPIDSLPYWGSFPLTDAESLPESATVTPNKCTRCDGTGQSDQCPECDGDGEFVALGDYSGNEYKSECAMCKGYGSLSKEVVSVVRFDFVKTLVSCWRCGGMGVEEREISVVIDGHHFDPNLLYLAQQLGNIRFKIMTNVGDGVPTMLFEIGGVQGIILGRK